MEILFFLSPGCVFLYFFSFTPIVFQRQKAHPADRIERGMLTEADDKNRAGGMAAGDARIPQGGIIFSYPPFSVFS